MTSMGTGYFLVLLLQNKTRGFVFTEVTKCVCTDAVKIEAKNPASHIVIFCSINSLLLYGGPSGSPAFSSLPNHLINNNNKANIYKII